MRPSSDTWFSAMSVVRDYPIRHAEADGQHERFGTPPHGGRPALRVCGPQGPTTGAPSLFGWIAPPLDGAARLSSTARRWRASWATPPGGSRAALHQARAARSACRWWAAASPSLGTGRRRALLVSHKTLYSKDDLRRPRRPTPWTSTTTGCARRVTPSRPSIRATSIAP